MDASIFVVIFLVGVFTVGTVELNGEDNVLVDCLEAEIYQSNKYNYSAMKVSKELGESVIKKDNTVSPEQVPWAPESVYLNETTGDIIWFTKSRLHGMNLLKHVLLRVEQYLYEAMKDTQYYLINISGSTFHKKNAIFTWRCFTPYRTAYKAEATVWFMGALQLQADGSWAATVNGHSEAQTNVAILNRDYQEKKRQANMCICEASIRILVSRSFTTMRGQIQGFHVPLDTPIEIQVIESSTKDPLQRWLVTGQNISLEPYRIVCNVTEGNSYFILVKLKCLYSYPVMCGKREADVYKSQEIHIEKKGPGLHNVFAENAPFVASAEVTNNSADVKHLLQVVVVTVIFFGCILVELTVMCFVCRCIVSKDRHHLITKQKQVTCHSGEVSAMFAPRRKVAIIFAKDSSLHVERVFQLISALNSLGIQTEPFDEDQLPEMMSNWIDVAEGVVKDFDHIIFVASSNVFLTCRKKMIVTSLDNREVEESMLPKHTLHNVPAVVLNALKTQTAWAGRMHTKVYLTYFDADDKVIAKLMQKEHPTVFKTIHRHTKVPKRIMMT